MLGLNSHLTCIMVSYSVMPRLEQWKLQSSTSTIALKKVKRPANVKEETTLNQDSGVEP